MSYNYDANPWDDNYTPNPSHSAQPTGGYSADPAAGTSAGANYYPNSGYYDQAGYAANPGADQYQQQPGQDPSGLPDQQQQFNQQQQQQQHHGQPKSASFVGKFLHQRCPALGSIYDTVSGINLPFMDALFQHVNRDLLVSKMFYFFFYSAFGSLFPLMGVYFKQLGMNPLQVGILTGVRPFIEIFSAPFWNSLAERFHKSKALLLFSLLSWIIFTYSLAHIRPPASACIAFNDSHYLLYTPYSNNELSNFNIEEQRIENEIAAAAAAAGSSSSAVEGSSDTLEVEQSKMAVNDKDEQLALTGGPRANINKDREGKDEILASEENQNDQRKRRRRRRQAVDVDDPRSRYAYGLDAARHEPNLAANQLDLDLDLESDFEDSLLVSSGRQNRKHQQQQSNSDDDSNNVDDDDDDFNHNSNTIRTNSLRIKRQTESETDNREDVDNNNEESDEVEAKNDDSDETNELQRVHQSNSAKVNQYKEAANSPQQPANTIAISTTTPNSQEEENTNMQVSANKTRRVYKQRHKTPPTHVVGMSPITVEYAYNYNNNKHSQFVAPMFSTIVYKLDDVKGVFVLLLLLISLGEFFSAPALTLADSATLSYLGDNTDLYGRQRMFGSLSWAITLLLVGMALDNATIIADHPCGPNPRERSYTVCFAIFSLLMACALLTATQFRFNYQKVSTNGNYGQTVVTSAIDNNNNVVTTTVDGSSATGNVDQLYASTQPRSIFNTAPPINAQALGQQAGGVGKEKFELLDKWKSAVFAQRTWEVPEWWNVFCQFRNSLHLTYLFITWFLGCGVGLVFTFLFWHLQDVGGTPTLFGICSVINHISEILAYFFSLSFIKRFGHTKVLSVGLGCNVIRFIYVAFLTNPYYALPFELVQGITHAACFAACCSKMNRASKPELRTSTQGVMQGLHHGIGRACGTLIGGYMINAIGSRASFCIYGLLSGCVLGGFLYVRKRASELDDDTEVKEDSDTLGGFAAPQGVPSAVPGKIAQSVPVQDIDYQW